MTLRGTSSAARWTDAPQTGPNGKDPSSYPITEGRAQRPARSYIGASNGFSREGGPQVIARLWLGWTSPEDAEDYERLLRDTVLPDLSNIDGYEGGFVLRRDLDDEVEFAVLNLFASLDAVR